MRVTLGELFDRYHSDKTRHGYDKLYEQLLEHRTVRAVLEVGIGTRNRDAVSTTVGFFPDGYEPGASLRAWVDYFPAAAVWGMDTQPDTMITDPRIATKLCDSTDAEQVSATLNGHLFDLVVDDGDHHPDSQLATLRNLWPHVRVGGLYVMEDVSTLNVRAVASIVGARNWFAATLRPSQSCMGFIVAAIPRR